MLWLLLEMLVESVQLRSADFPPKIDLFNLISQKQKSQKTVMRFVLFSSSLLFCSSFTWMFSKGISVNSFLPWIVFILSCTSKKNSFGGNCSCKYGSCFFDQIFERIRHLSVESWYLFRRDNIHKPFLFGIKRLMVLTIEIKNIKVVSKLFLSPSKKLWKFEFSFFDKQSSSTDRV